MLAGARTNTGPASRRLIAKGWLWKHESVGAAPKMHERYGIYLISRAGNVIIIQKKTRSILGPRAYACSAQWNKHPKPTGQPLLLQNFKAIRDNAARMMKPFFLPHASADYRPDIDGLRAFAVLSVVLYHAFPKAIRGGYVGVDVFFVISGFLISSILFAEMTEHRFSFTAFYERRIRRIFPALAVCLAAVLAYGFVSLTPSELAQLGKHMFFGAGFLSNMVLWSESGYFDSAATYKPLLHLWSLGIEEQFYILWPVLLWVAFRLKAKVGRLLAVLFLASFTINVALSITDISA